MQCCYKSYKVTGEVSNTAYNPIIYNITVDQCNDFTGEFTVYHTVHRDTLPPTIMCLMVKATTMVVPQKSASIVKVKKLI